MEGGGKKMHKRKKRVVKIFLSWPHAQQGSPRTRARRTSIEVKGINRDRVYCALAGGRRARQ